MASGSRESSGSFTRITVSQIASERRVETNPTGKALDLSEQRVEANPIANPLYLREEDYDLTSTAVGKDSSMRLYLYTMAQRMAHRAPWFPEYGILHRMNIADINNKLARCKKEIYDKSSASDEQMELLRKLLADQATAIRNFDYIQSQDWYIQGESGDLQKEVSGYFEDIAGATGTKNGYDSENYRCLAIRPKPYELGDPIRYFICRLFPAWLTYSPEEKRRQPKSYQENLIPTEVSPQVDSLARLTIAMFGALSILVPMIIMSLDRSRTKSLVTTSIAVVIFACCCSFTLRTGYDQTLAATVGYAAVLMVFVGLTL